MPILSLVVSAVGYCLGLFYFATAVPSLGGEKSEWAFWALLTATLYPAVSFLSRNRAARLFFISAAILHAAYTTLEITLRFGEGGNFFLALLVTTLSFAVYFGLARLLQRRALFVKPTVWQSLLLASVIFFLTRLGEHPVGFPFFHFKYVVDIFVFVATTLFFWKVFFSRESKQRSPHPWLRWIAYSFFLLWGLQPLLKFHHSALHHWTFYVGPLELVRQGGLLLYDVPSQYGFLSILLPALLPFSPIFSFQLVFALTLLAQAVLVFELAQRLPARRFHFWFALIVTFSLVYLLPGDRNDLGALSYPNNTAYRFLWVLVCAFALAENRMKAFYAAFALGALWSLESLAFCVGGLGFYCAAHLLMGNKKQAINVAMSSGGIIVGLFLLLEAVYRLGYGVAPDWYSYVEYSRAYSEYFTTTLMVPSRGFDLVLVLNALMAVYLYLRRPRSASAFALLGAVFSTDIYFITRSDWVNAITLAAIWIPVLFYFFAQEISLETNVLLFLLCALFVPYSMQNPTGKTLAKGFRNFARMHHEDPFPKSDLPLAHFGLESQPFPLLGHTPWLPSHPAVGFCILPKYRRDIYLTRYLQRIKFEKAEMLISYERKKCIDETIEFLERDYTKIFLPSAFPKQAILRFERKRP